jgi:lysophospholipase L1-like esterase
MPSAVRLPLRSLLAALLLATVAAPAAVAAPGPSTASAPAPARILVVGDSLAVGLEPYLGSMLAPGEVVWDARSGRTTPQGLPRLRARLREATPDTVVLSLGTNDGSDPRRFADRIRRALAAIPTTSCVVWVDVNRPARKGRYGALNRVLRDTARTDPRVTVVGWDRTVLAGRVRLPDGLHPDPAGFRLRSRLIADAVAHGCRARTA